MKIGRNAPCPCGSGKKYKKCCLRKNEASPLDRRQEKGFALKKPDKRTIPEEAPDRQSQESFDEDLSDDAKERAFYKAFWKNFGSADFTEKVKIVEEAFTNPKLIDEDIFFDLFNGLKIVASNID